jgi:hypothetical protein
MAILNITATPSGGLRHYTLAMDRHLVRMHADNTGTQTVSGECGDGSPHRLGYSLAGPTGAKLEFKLSCEGGADIPLPSVEIFREGEPLGAGIIEFQL